MFGNQSGEKKKNPPMTLKLKLILSFTGIALLVGVVGGFNFLLSNQIRGLRTIELPMEQNLREVEVSIWETIHAADSFRLSGNKFYKELYNEQTGNVEEFLSKYAALTDTEEERQFLEEFRALWEAAKAAGSEMIELTEKQKSAEDAFFVNVDEADDVIDFEIQGKWQPTDPNILEKEQNVREVEVSIWEAIHAGQQFTGLSADIVRGEQKYVGNARKAAQRGAKASLVKGDFADLMERQFEDVKEYWTKYKALALKDFEKDAIKEFEGYWEKAVKAGREVVLLQDKAETQFNILSARINEADDVIDFKMQEFIQQRIGIEGEKAKQIRAVATAISIATLICAVIIGILMSRSICRPIAELEKAAAEIKNGNLSVVIKNKSKDEIGALADSFEEMAKSLKKSMDRLNAEITERTKAEQRQAGLIKKIEDINKELQDFAYTASHDLKAPLRGIKSIVEWIAKDYSDKIDQNGREQMMLLSTRVDRLQNMINGILEYSKVGRTSEKKEKFNLNEYIAEIIDLIAPPGNVTITVENELPVIECEKTRIGQIFQNIISNAVKYMDKTQGYVKIGCVDEGRFYKFSVADNGPGIEEKYFEKIFQIFQKLQRRDEVEGSGIGLALVKKIIETYGGKIWLESEVGKGSTFFFTLPKHSLVSVSLTEPCLAAK